MNEMSMEQWRKDAEEEKGKKWGEKPGQVFLRALLFPYHFHSISIILATPLLYKTHSSSCLVRVCSLQHRHGTCNGIHSRLSLCLIQAPHQDVGENRGIALHILNINTTW